MEAYKDKVEELRKQQYGESELPEVPEETEVEEPQVEEKRGFFGFLKRKSTKKIDVPKQEEVPEEEEKEPEELPSM